MIVDIGKVCFYFSKISLPKSKRFPPELELLFFFWELDYRPELSFGDLPGIKRIAEGVQGLKGIRAEPEEAQHLGNPGMREADCPGECPLRPEIPDLHRLRPLPGQEDRVPVSPDGLCPLHPPSFRFKNVVEHIPDEGSLRHRTGEFAKEGGIFCLSFHLNFNPFPHSSQVSSLEQVNPFRQFPPVSHDFASTSFSDATGWEILLSDGRNRAEKKREPLLVFFGRNSKNIFFEPAGNQVAIP